MKFAYLIEPPFNYRMEGGNVTGCDVELARTVFAELGITSFEPVETEFAELLPGVSEGRWGMTTGLFATAERQQMAAFSRPVWGLSDGLLVRRGNPLGLSGYRSIATAENCTLAVIRDQFQHRSAVEFGVPDDRIRIFDTYTVAATAVHDGTVDAYASVGRAHTGYLDRNRGLEMDVVTVPVEEKKPAFGSFAFSRNDDEFRARVDDVLKAYIGSTDHRAMMGTFGFSSDEVDLTVNWHA